MLSNKQIQELIPHRYPFLLIDKILEVEPGKRCVAIKNVSVNEPFFQGHFPGNPIMPGVLIVEALAQTACIAGAMVEQYKDKLGIFASIDSMKFTRQVTPGDTIKLIADIVYIKMRTGKVNVKAYVDDEVVAEGIIKFAFVDKNSV